MPNRSKLNEIASKQGRSVKEILTDYYRKYGKQKDVADALGIAPSTVSQNVARLGGHEHTIVIFPEEVKGGEPEQA